MIGLRRYHIYVEPPLTIAKAILIAAGIISMKLTVTGLLFSYLYGSDFYGSLCHDRSNTPLTVISIYTSTTYLF